MYKYGLKYNDKRGKNIMCKNEKLHNHSHIGGCCGSENCCSNHGHEDHQHEHEHVNGMGHDHHHEDGFTGVHTHDHIHA
jgi:hypothetical protein